MEKSLLLASQSWGGGGEHGVGFQQDQCLEVQMTDCVLSFPGQKDNRPGDKFQLTFPLRTNYMYAKVKKSLPEMYAFSVCMWLKSSAAPGVGTPFSYAVPGQANELVLIEWGNNPMEILINDKVTPPAVWTRRTAELAPQASGTSEETRRPAGTLAGSGSCWVQRRGS